MPLTTMYSTILCGWLWFLTGMRLHSWIFQQNFNNCKAHDSLASLSFLRLARFEQQNTVGTASDLRVALFQSKPLHYAEDKILLGKMMTADTCVIIIYVTGFE